MAKEIPPRFPRLPIEAVIDEVIKDFPFVKAHRSIVPHAIYHHKLRERALFVSLIVTKDGEDLANPSHEFMTNPRVSLATGINCRTNKSVVEFLLCEDLRHEEALKCVAYLAASVHWLIQFNALPDFFDFIKKSAQEVCPYTDYHFLRIPPMGIK